MQFEVDEPSELPDSSPVRRMICSKQEQSRLEIRKQSNKNLLFQVRFKWSQLSFTSSSLISFVSSNPHSLPGGKHR